MENDEEINAIDFGARIYDGRLGRFFSSDPYSEYFKDLSPYHFAGNDPIRYIDIEGNFKIDAVFAKKYPSLAKVIKYYLPLLKDNPEVKAAFMKVTGYSSDEFDKMVSFGSGPWVTPVPVGPFNSWIGHSGAPYQNQNQFVDAYPNNIFLISERFQELEDLMKGFNKTKTNDEIAAQILVVTMAIMHEATHYAFYDKNPLSKRDLPNGEDQGFIFTKKAFGSRFSKTGPTGETYDDNAAKNYYKNNINSTKIFGMSFSPNYRGFYNNLIFGRFGNNVNIDIPKSHGTDPAVPTMKSPRTLCFDGSTLIMLKDGTQKQIKDILKSDTIVTYDIKDNVVEFNKVNRVISVYHDDIITIKFSDGTSSINTYDHSYYVKGKGWCSYSPQLSKSRYSIKVSQLEKGDIVYKYSNGRLEELVVSFIETIPGGRQTFTLFTVGDNHTFFANKILVYDDYIENYEK